MKKKTPRASLASNAVWVPPNPPPFSQIIIKNKNPPFLDPLKIKVTYKEE
jgi:hypothetical protein